MDYVYVFSGMFVSIIAFFKRELLARKESFRIIFGVSVVLFVAGLVLHFIETNPSSFSGALLTPLLSLGMFRLCRRVFLMRLQREPKDTYLNWANGLAPDRFFNIIYFGSAIWIELIITGAMMELTKAGW